MPRVALPVVMTPKTRGGGMPAYYYFTIVHLEKKGFISGFFGFFGELSMTHLSYLLKNGHHLRPTLGARPGPASGRHAPTPLDRPSRWVGTVHPLSNAVFPPKRFVALLDCRSLARDR